MQREITLAIRGEEDGDAENGQKTVKRKRRRRGPAKSVFCLLCIIIFLLGLLTGKLVFPGRGGNGKNGEKGDGFGRDGRRI